MQVRFTADITNDGNEGVLVLDGYLEGTKPQIPFRERIEVPPHTTVMDELIAVFVRPVIGASGKDFAGRVISSSASIPPTRSHSNGWERQSRRNHRPPLAPKQLYAQEPPAKLVTKPPTASETPQPPPIPLGNQIAPKSVS